MGQSELAVFLPRCQNTPVSADTTILLRLFMKQSRRNRGSAGGTNCRLRRASLMKIVDSCLFPSGICARWYGVVVTVRVVGGVGRRVDEGTPHHCQVWP